MKVAQGSHLELRGDEVFERLGTEIAAGDGALVERGNQPPLRSQTLIGGANQASCYRAGRVAIAMEVVASLSAAAMSISPALVAFPPQSAQAARVAVRYGWRKLVSDVAFATVASLPARSWRGRSIARTATMPRAAPTLPAC